MLPDTYSAYIAELQKEGADWSNRLLELEAMDKSHIQTLGQWKALYAAGLTRRNPGDFCLWAVCKQYGGEKLLSAKVSVNDTYAKIGNLKIIQHAIEFEENPADKSFKIEGKYMVYYLRVEIGGSIFEATYSQLPILLAALEMYLGPAAVPDPITFLKNLNSKERKELCNELGWENSYVSNLVAGRMQLGLKNTNKLLQFMRK